MLLDRDFRASRKPRTYLGAALMLPRPVTIFGIVRPPRKEPAMTHFKTLLIAAPVALGLLAAPAAHAEWRGGGGGWGHHAGWGYRGGYGYRGGWGWPLAGALVGAAIVGGAVAASQPPVVYAAPPAYYPPPAYYGQPYYYAPPPPAYAPQ